MFEPLDWLSSKIVGRKESFFAEDLNNSAYDLSGVIRGARILLIGGAGSIGFQTLLTVLKFSPKAVHVVDHNENALAELVRTLRSSSQQFQVEDLLTLPMDYGSRPFDLWMKSHAHFYDYVLNFAALKHVRSEKNPYTILSMLDTNVLKLVNILDEVKNHGSIKRFFCVSTDKAANPSSMMGATKRLMEHALFLNAQGRANTLAVTSARFANVAFSNGSLLQSWQNRLALRQPMACPEGCRRFFVALPESGHLCTLAGMLGKSEHIMVPALNPQHHLMLLQDVIVWFLEAQGLTPYFTHDEAEALGLVEELAAQGQWPVLLTPLNTSGEKPYEEFVGVGERSLPSRFASMQQVAYLPPENPDSFRIFIRKMKELLETGDASPLDVTSIKDAIACVEQDFSRTHVVSSRSLDQRI